MITQLSSVKSRLGIDAFDTADNTLLTNAIKAVGARFNQQCNRIFERAAGAVYEFQADKIAIWPALYPIESISAWELKSNETDGFETLDTPDYILRKAGNIKCLVYLAAPLGSENQVARITYTGGYVAPGTTPGSGQTALPDDIEQAAIEQVAYWYQNKARLGITAISGDGGSIQQFAQLDLLPSVKATLKAHERWLP